jgi:hypothetical protein
VMTSRGTFRHAEVVDAGDIRRLAAEALEGEGRPFLALRRLPGHVR